SFNSLVPYFPFRLFFFFQAEDGIRDRNVTGVQTCALPILYLTISVTSSSSRKAPWTRIGLERPDGKKSISPRPSSFSAPIESIIVLESVWELTAKAIRDGIFALIIPVMTSTDGLCVAIIK